MDQSTTPASTKSLSDQQKRFRTILVVSAFILFSIILIGLFWLSQTTRAQAGWLAFSYATGLSMIVLPCTLPLAFVIVPLAMGRSAKKGLMIALAFALGVTITLSIYGAIIAKLGQVVGLDRAKDVMYTIAGVFAVVFGLGELGLIKLRVPAYSGAFPKFIQERKDVGKGFLLGLLLGNVGMGCPNPAFYVLLSYIATVGSVATGWFLTFIHAVGRVTPLLLLAILAILGVDALTALVKRREVLMKVTAWFVVFVGAFVLVLGLQGHDWYVYSGIHSTLESISQEAKFVTQYAKQFGDTGLDHGHALPSGPYLIYGSWLMVTLLVIPMIWNWRRKYKDIKPEETEKRKALNWMGAAVISFSLFLYLLFGVTLPNWFRYQVVPAHGQEEMAADHREAEAAHFDIQMNAFPAPFEAGKKLTLEFKVVDKTSGRVITNLDIAHEKPMHVVGIRKEDVGNFLHIHPQLSQDVYATDYIFVEDGTYVLWAEAVHQGAEASLRMPDLVIGTPPIVSYLPAFDKILKLADDLVVQLKTPTVLEADQSNLFGFAITDEGGFDVPLGKYLAENMHITIVSQDLEHFHHLHSNYGEIGEEHEPVDHHESLNVPFVPKALAHGPVEDEHPEDEADPASSAFGPNDLLVKFAFPKPGLYKIFAEFVTQKNPNQVQRAEYWVRVEKSMPTTSASREAPFSKITLTIASLIIIAAVMPLIFNYLKEEKIKV